MQEKASQVQPIQTEVTKMNLIIAGMRKDGTVVKRVILHQAFSIPGGTTESSLYEHKGYSMLLFTEGLVCKYKNQEFLVPAANIAVAFTS